jgi:hypothetical protein
MIPLFDLVDGARMGDSRRMMSARLHGREFELMKLHEEGAARRWTLQYMTGVLCGCHPRD